MTEQDLRFVLQQIIDDVQRTPPNLRNQALADRVAQRAQAALWGNVMPDPEPNTGEWVEGRGMRARFHA